MEEQSSKRARLILVMLGVTLVVVFFARIHPRAIAAQLSRVGPEVMWLAVPYALGTALGAFPWAWLLPPRARPTPRGIVASRFVASGANALLPFFGLAGEPSRLMWLPSAYRAQGTAAIVVDRVIYNLASALLLLAGCVVAFFFTSLSPIVCGIAAAIAFVLIAFTFGVLHGVSRWGVGRRLHKWVTKLFGDRGTHAAFGADLDLALESLIRAARPQMWLGAAAHFAGRVLLGAEVYVALWVLHANPTLAHALVLATVPVATGIVASTIPSQLGVQEAAQALVCGALGMDPAVGFTLVLLQRVRQVFFVPLTPVLIGFAHAD